MNHWSDNDLKLWVESNSPDLSIYNKYYWKFGNINLNLILGFPDVDSANNFLQNESHQYHIDFGEKSPWENIVNDYPSVSNENPIVLICKNDRYEIIDGWHRVAAMRMSGETQIPAIIGIKIESGENK